MSQLNISTLANLAGSENTPIADVVNGRARAWVNFNGTGTVAIRASYNVSSITDNGAGDYTVNFATDMPDVNYCVTSHGGGASSGIAVIVTDTANITFSVGSFVVRSIDYLSFADLGLVCVAVFR